MENKRSSVAVVIPCYNESESILKLVNELLTIDFIEHIAVVDDSPDDGTIDQLVSLKDDPRLLVIHRTSKGGRGSAVIEGMLKMLSYQPDYIIEMDADFSHQPQEIPNLINKIVASQADLMVASRYLPGSKITNWPIKRKLFSKASNIFAKTLLRIPVSDYTNGFRVYTYRAAKLITETPLLGTGFIALSDVLVRVYYKGYKISEVPTSFHNRTRGESALCFSEISNAFFGIFKIYQSAKKLKENRPAN